MNETPWLAEYLCGLLVFVSRADAQPAAVSEQGEAGAAPAATIAGPAEAQEQTLQTTDDLRVLGAEEDDDTCRVDSRWFWGHGKGHMLVNLEYACGNSDHQGIYLKFGCGW